MNNELCWEDLTSIGNDLSAEEVAELELRVESNPMDVESRAKILGFYLLKRFGQYKQTASSREQHALWFIKNMPAHPISGTPFAEFVPLEHGYVEAARQWSIHAEQLAGRRRRTQGK